MKHVVLLHERWQLGDVISVKVRRVPSIKADRLTVCCVPNQRFLYPNATDFVDVPEGLDGLGAQELSRQLADIYPEAEFITMSRAFAENLDFRVKVPEHEAVFTDALLCPRMKLNSSPYRNWPHWAYLNELMMGGVSDGFYTGIAGNEPGPFNGRHYFHVRDLESIAAHMLKTKLVVATDSGLAHLAILLDVPLAVIWGTPVGVIRDRPYEKSYHRHMERQKRSPVWHIEGGWDYPDKVFQEVKKILCTL